MRLSGLVQSEFGDVARVGLEFAALDLLDDIDETFVGTGLKPDLFALADDEAIKEFDLGTTALHHVLPHRRTLLGRAAPFALPMLVIARERRGVAFAGAGDHLRRQVT